MEGFSIVLGTVLLLVAIVVPGMAVTLAIYPRWRDIAFVERMGLSFILGMLPQLFIYLLNKNISLEVTSSTSLLSILAVTAVGLIVYYRRRS